MKKTMLVLSLWLAALPALATDLVANQGAPVAYLQGGVGQDEREMMAQMADRYNLRMRFATTGSGAYRSGVVVDVFNAGGTVLHLGDAGPLCYVKLPPGKYTVRAEAGGKAQQRAVTVPATAWRELVFYWTGPPNE